MDSSTAGRWSAVRRRRRVGAVAAIVVLGSLGLSFSTGSAGPAEGAQPQTDPPCIVNTFSGLCNVDYSFTGSLQQFIVPDGVAALTITAYGGYGGSDASGFTGGDNGAVTGTLAVKPDEALTMLIGGDGGSGTSSGGGGAGGYGGGGTGGDGAGGGGGATVISSPGGQVQLVAGGGGGTTNFGLLGASGGNLGSITLGDITAPSGLNGGSAAGTTSNCENVCGAPGLGGTQTSGGGGFSSGSGPATSTSGGSGGAGGDFFPFDVLNGGDGGGGGGAGYFGGGGGGGGGGPSEVSGGSGGGGGSSFTAADITDVQNTAGGFEVNNNGDGSVELSYPDPCAADLALTGSAERNKDTGVVDVNLHATYRPPDACGVPKLTVARTGTAVRDGAATFSVDLDQITPTTAKAMRPLPADDSCWVVARATLEQSPPTGTATRAAVSTMTELGPTSEPEIKTATAVRSKTGVTVEFSALGLPPADACGHAKLQIDDKGYPEAEIKKLKWSWSGGTFTAHADRLPTANECRLSRLNFELTPPPGLGSQVTKNDVEITGDPPKDCA